MRVIVLSQSTNTTQNGGIILFAVAASEWDTMSRAERRELMAADLELGATRMLWDVIQVFCSQGIATVALQNGFTNVETGTNGAGYVAVLPERNTSTVAATPTQEQVLADSAEYQALNAAQKAKVKAAIAEGVTMADAIAAL